MQHSRLLYKLRPWLGAVLAISVLVLMSSRARGATLTGTDAEKEIDKQQMRKIYEAIERYQKDHDRRPTWLSDLVPDYLSDPSVFVSPVEKRTGWSQIWGYSDPKLKVSYVYEFSGNQAGGSVNQGRETPLTMGEWKTLQMAEFGPATPLLRCHLYDPILNLSVAGEFYETSLFWESDPATLELVKRLGPGPGLEEQKRVQVEVVHAETGEPLSGAKVTVSERQSELGPLPARTVTTDEEGKCEVPLGGLTPQSASLSFDKAGFANAPVHWEGGPSIFPETYTVKLTPAESVGGRVVEKGGPGIAGAQVTISGVTRDAVGQFLLVPYDSVETDDNGRWFSDRIPEGFSALNFKLSHPEYFASEYDQAEGDVAEEGEVTRADLLANRAVMHLMPGLVVAGTITGPDNQPVEGAEILLRDAADAANKQSQITNAEGKFRFVVLDGTEFILLAMPDGLAPDFRRINVKPEMEPLELELRRGRTLRGRVLDQNGEPIEGVGVSVTSWENLDLLQWGTVTDAEGRFRWDSAPEGALMLTALMEGLMAATQPAPPDPDAEMAFRLAKSFLLTGRVLDAETKEPIPQFSLVPGNVWRMADADQVNWQFHNEQQGSGGNYSITSDDHYGGTRKFLVRAEGYLPSESPAFPSQGWHTHDFELQQGDGPSGIVHGPDDQPLQGAEVALVGAGYLSMGKGAFNVRGSGRDTFVCKTDPQGRFSLPAVLASPVLVAVHDEGYAEVSGDQLAEDEVVRLAPWGRVEGVLRNGTRPATNVKVMIGPRQSGPGGLHYDFDTFTATTDDQGRFSFSNVPPGERQLVRLIPIERGWRWSHQQPLIVNAGEVTEVIYGGTGRPIIGQLKLSDPSREVDWNVGHHSFSTKVPRPPGPFRSQEEAEAWRNSPEVKEAFENRRSYGLEIAEDGSFRMENIPAGEYQLSIHLREPSADGFPMGKPIGSVQQDVVVEEIPNGVSDEPLDIGTLTVQVRD